MNLAGQPSARYTGAEKGQEGDDQDIRSVLGTEGMYGMVMTLSIRCYTGWMYAHK